MKLPGRSTKDYAMDFECSEVELNVQGKHWIWMDAEGYWFWFRFGIRRVFWVDIYDGGIIFLSDLCSFFFSLWHEVEMNGSRYGTLFLFIFEWKYLKCSIAI